MSSKYCNYILDTIRKATEDKDWIASDYLIPLGDFYRTLDGKGKKEFDSSLFKLISSKVYLNNLIDICRDLKISNCCSLLIRIFSTSVDFKKDNRFFGRDGVRRNIVYTLGFLRCKEALPFLKQLINIQMNTKLVSSCSDVFGVLMYSLTNISPQESSKYFGWWLNSVQKIENTQLASVKTLDDWKMMEETSAFFSKSASIYGFSSIKSCIVSVAQNRGLAGLNKWLKSVSLYTELDREFLKKQIQILADGSNDLFPNLRKICGYKKEPGSLASKLSRLPSLKQR
ncbi:MAG: hypothetical protein PHS61_00010 [Candidatus Omnitrophica bacterium]|nr:hypothetical protein [Candidatus Omnitrophota bacterium]